MTTKTQPNHPSQSLCVPNLQSSTVTDIKSIFTSRIEPDATRIEVRMKRLEPSVGDLHKQETKKFELQIEKHRDKCLRGKQMPETRKIASSSSDKPPESQSNLKLNSSGPIKKRTHSKATKRSSLNFDRAAAEYDSYGRPYMMREVALDIIKTLPPIGTTASELNTFAVKLRTAVNILKSIDQQAYLMDRFLTNDIIQKLSPHMQFRWCDYAKEFNKKNEGILIMLSNFLIREADLAMEYLYPN